MKSRSLVTEFDENQELLEEEESSIVDTADDVEDDADEQEEPVEADNKRKWMLGVQVALAAGIIATQVASFAQ